MKCMNRTCLLLVLMPLLMLAAGVEHVEAAETRRAGGDDVLRKAQYMIRQLSQEKTELQNQIIEKDSKLVQLEKQLKAGESRLAKSKKNGHRLAQRVKSDSDKFRTLVDRYRETLGTLRQSHNDNQYLVKAVQEREQWVEECGGRNQELFEANSDLLVRYKKSATRFLDPFTGIGTVTVENETQEYRFKLEDLQVTKFKSSVDTEAHIQKPREAEKVSLAN